MVRYMSQFLFFLIAAAVACFSTALAIWWRRWPLGMQGQLGLTSYLVFCATTRIAESSNLSQWLPVCSLFLGGAITAFAMSDQPMPNILQFVLASALLAPIWSVTQFFSFASPESINNVWVMIATAGFLLCAAFSYSFMQKAARTGHAGEAEANELFQVEIMMDERELKRYAKQRLR